MDEIKPADKSKLEIEKLNLEVQELRKRWFQRAPYLTIVLTAIIAITTFVLTMSSGIIDIEKKTLELKKEKLEKEIADFEGKKGLLRDSILVFKDSVNEFRKKETEYIKRYNDYQAKEKLYIEKLRNENKRDEIIEYYKNRLDSLVKLRIFHNTFDNTFN